MQREFVRKILFGAMVMMVVGVAFVGVSVIARARPDSLVPIDGQTVPLIRSSRVLSAANGQQQLALSIGLRLQNQQALNTLLSNLYNPRSSQYHHFLTPQQFAAEFAPSQAQQQQVISYLNSQGLTVTSTAPNGLLIDASATIAQAQAAFSVKINNYQSGARQFYANANVPSIPSSLSSIVMSIGGLDNSVRWHPLSQRAPHVPAGGYGPSDLVGAYDAAPLHQAGVKGSGQTVAVFELDGYQSSDITQYLQSNNLGNPSITNVLVDGSDGSAGAGAIEAELDIEVVAAMAPQASQVVYEGPNSTQGVNDTYNRIVTDRRAQVVTTSWGECEAQSGTAELQTLDGIFQQASAQGMTIYAAAGDSGAYDCNDTNLAVDSPADDPYVTGVGGTNLQANNGVYGSESVWSNATDTQRSPQGSGGGGGLSGTFAQPSWQAGPGVNNQYSNGKREVPDVSADADPQTGYAVYCTVSASGCPSTGNIVVGGTSAAAPLWAGSTALINQYLQQQGKSPVGFASPAFYGLANAQQTFAPFHDVTSGNNLFYPAMAGYDLASGVGTPDIYNIARDIASGNASPPTPTPGGTPTPTPTNTPTPVPTNPPGPTATATPVPPPPTGTLLQNGSFENGTGPWQESSSGGYELIDSKNPHSGNFGADLCGYSSCNDVVEQSFKVPASSSALTLTYWWNGTTTRTAATCRDSFTAQLLNSAGKSIVKVQHACNTDATNSWQEVSSDLTSTLARYANQTVTLVLSARTASASSVTTTFFVDDVLLRAS